MSLLKSCLDGGFVPVNLRPAKVQGETVRFFVLGRGENAFARTQLKQSITVFRLIIMTPKLSCRTS